MNKTKPSQWAVRAAYTAAVLFAIHLRLCLTCGHVGCCDSSKNKHATKHFHATNHPLLQSFESGEDWLWCYVDEVVLEAA